MRKTVTLNPGESKVITFGFTPIVPKTYQVSVDGLFGSFNAIEMPVPFIFSDVWVKKVVFNDAPAFDTMEFYCTITNPNNVTITETLKALWRYGTGITPHLLWTFRLTLARGASDNFFWDGNRYGQRKPGVYNGPLVGVRTKICMWLEDEWGNKSEEGCVSG